MMIICTIHGGASCFEASADLLSAVMAKQTLPSYREIIYEHEEGDIEMVILISEQFAKEHNVKDNGTVELPDDYPKWHQDLVFICRTCAEEAGIALPNY